MKKNRFNRKTEKWRKSFFLFGLVLALTATYLTLTIQSSKIVHSFGQQTEEVADDLVIPITIRDVKKPKQLEQQDKQAKLAMNKVHSQVFKIVDDKIIYKAPDLGNGIEEVPEPEEYAEEEVLWDIVDRKPIFPGCEELESEQERSKCFQEGLTKHIRKNFKQKQSMGMANQEKIYINFVIDRDGNVKDIKAIRGDKYNREGLKKAIEQLPKLVPAMYKGRYVNTAFSLPIVIRN